MFDTEKLIEYLKTRKIQFLDETNITSVEVETETYNPFDVNFACRLYFDNDMLIVIRKDINSFLVRVGRNTGWIGGLYHADNIEMFNISKLDTDSLIEGFKGNVQLYTLCTKYSTGSVDKKLFKGTLKECGEYAITNGYERKTSQEYMLADGLHRTSLYNFYKGTFREFYYVKQKENSRYNEILSVLVV